MMPDEWAASNRIYGETTGMPGPRDPTITPYMIPFVRGVHEGRYSRVVSVTSAQSGKTEAMLDIIGTRLDQRPAPILYVGPTKDFVSQQFEPRLMQLLNEAKSLKAKVLRGKRMRQTLKYVAGVSVRLAHAGSSSALKSDAAAVALVDEFDEMSANIRGQGDPLGLVEARGETYADFVTAIVSTTSQGIAEVAIDPESGLEFWQVGDTDQIESPIWRLWQEGTRHHWAWPCPHCDEFFIPRFKHLSWPKNASPARALREAWLTCPCCGGVIVDDHKAEMNRRGVMVAPGQKIIEGVVIGEPPENTTLSFWTSGLASPFVTWGKRADSYLKALLSGEPDKIQTTINAGFGELYAPGANSGDTPDWQAVMKHTMPYKTREMPLGVIRLVCGVDVQRKSLIYTIRGFGGRGTSWLIEAGVLYGSTDEDEVWEALEDLILNPIGGLHIEKTLIDSGFRPDKPESGSEHRVYAFCRKWKQLCSPTKGRATGMQPYTVSKIEVKPTGKKAVYSINLVHVNTDFFKQLVHSRLQTPLDRPGAFYLPSDVTEDYCKQLVSEVRVTNRGSKPTWVLRSKHNHFLDTEALCAVAGYILNVQRIPEGMTRDAAFNDDQNIHDVEEQIVEQESTAVDVVKTSNVRDRFKGISSRLNR